MPKYYVQCQQHKLIIDRESSKSAALELLFRTLRDQTWVYHDDALTSFDRYQHLALEALLNLTPSI